MPDAKQKFISECIADCIRKGTPKDQAAAICYSKWEKKHSKNNSIKIYRKKNNRKVYKYSAKTVGGYESPEPGGLSKKGADMLARVYAEARKSGDDKEMAAKKSWSAVSKAGYKNQAENIEQKIFDFFRNNPNPDDNKVHAFAESNNIEPSQLEEQIYKLISTFVSGGKSIGKTDFPEDQMQKGLKVELEHVDKDSPYAEMIARKISADHLSEMSDYYDKLAIMEKGE